MRVRAVLLVLALALLVAGSVWAEPTITLKTPRPAPGSAPLPWLALGGIFALAISCAATVRDRRRAILTAAALLGSGLAVFALRWAVLPRAFFHQNGHGPLWIEYALHDDPGLSPYGPGFGELFGAAARASGADPERGVFLLQAVLGAAVPALAFATARGLGAGRWTSAALAGALALDPLLARLALSESYFSSMCVLGFAAAAALAHGARRPSPRGLPFVAGVIAAGFFVAQAARIHPLGWIGLALLPIVVAVGPGGFRRRAIATLVAATGIALLVAVTSASEMLAVLSGSLGKQWLPDASPRALVLAQGAAPASLLVALLLAAALRSKRGIVLGAAAIGVLALMYTTDLLGVPNAAVDAAYDRLFWPVLAALGAAWLARAGRGAPRERVLAGLVVTAGLATAVLRFATLTRLPTDAREASFAMEWRTELPEGAIVAYVERSGRQILRLPLYDGVTRARPFPITLDEGAPDLSSVAGPLYYYRSGICSTEDARQRCAAIESGVRLEPLVERELPALPSMRWHPYASEGVHVALSRRP